MNPFEHGRRLCLLFEAGASRLCVEATSVVEVAPPDPQGQRFRGVHEIHDASVLFGGAPEERPGVVVLFDVSPTLAARVRRVRGVVDVAQATLFQLPPGLGEGMSTLVRNAVLHQEQLFLEIDAQKLSSRAGPRLAAPSRSPYFVSGWLDRALVFEAGGARFGVPLAFVSQVVPASDALCPLPCPEGPVVGLFPHGQALYPVYSVTEMLGGVATSERFLVLTELAGQSVGLAAAAVLGVYGPFTPVPEPGQFAAPGLAGNVRFLDFQRMFS